MENAARALLMAGGILFAIIIISVFMLGYSGMTQIQQEKEYLEAVKEIDKFNEAYLAFNKKAMYGSDVISVMNRAINNNKIYDADFGEEYYVNIVFVLDPLKGSVKNTEFTYVLNSNGTYTSFETTPVDSNKTFESGITYSLSTHEDQITEFLLTAGQNEETKTILDRSEGTILKYKIEYSGIAGFKRRAFKCSNVIYDGAGRVSQMEFKELYGG